MTIDLTTPRPDDRAWDIESDPASPHRGHVVHALDEGRWWCVTCWGEYVAD